LAIDPDQPVTESHRPVRAFYLLVNLTAPAHCNGAASKTTTQSTDRMVTKPKRDGFTLVEIMIVVAIIALLAAIAVPGFLRARKRSQAAKVLNDLRLIDSAIEQYAMETNKPTGANVYVTDWVKYLKKGSSLYQTGQDLFGNDYADQVVDSLPTVPAPTYDALSDVVDSTFWLPYKRQTTKKQINK
jgi:prepilin-type N-terminal cleavage/methylation domain-containing protein